ncbi:MAG: alpha amylase [Oscillospiraceae bacterium]|nr:alpha amylase [Oscillospiraceae bacterium]
MLLVVVMLVGCAPTSSDPAKTTGSAPTESTTAPSITEPSETEPSETEPSVTEPTEPPVTVRPSLEERLASYSALGTSPDDNYRTWYEIFVYSFCDSNGDGIGDLQGVISKLDYLEELGINGIWLMPIHPSTSYHKYNVDDYYAIDPTYGTMADFDQLMAECEMRGIKVILDLVVNHSGNNNPWFTEAVEYLQSLGLGEFGLEEECKYFGYYNFVESSNNPGRGYGKVAGTMYHYECQFSGDMPDLNWENEAMREDVKQVMKFWLDKGVAGFRVDAAKEFYTGNVTKNVEVMRWLQETATSLKSDAYMVAEVWETNYTLIAQYYESGFTSIFNYPFGNYSGKLIQVVNGRGNPAMVQTWATALQTVHRGYSGANPNFIDAPFLSNHDVLRIADCVSNDEYRIKMAGAMNLFMSGSAFVYYGEEIGMAGNGDKDSDPSKRAPMYWNADRDDGTTMKPPGCVLPTNGYPMGSLEEQRQDENSVYNYYREAIAIRQALPVISHGVTTAETTLNLGCVSAMRKTWGEEECIILMNIDANEEGAKVDLSAYADWQLVASLSANGENITLSGSELSMPAFGIAVLIPNN